jgi:hypothetical protein
MYIHTDQLQHVMIQTKLHMPIIDLMLKWIWKIYQGDEGLWADLVNAKYLQGRDLFREPSPPRALNSGMPYKRLSGTSNWGPNTKSIMGCAPISGWTGGQGWDLCQLASRGSLAAATNLLLRCTRREPWMDRRGNGACTLDGSLA